MPSKAAHVAYAERPRPGAATPYGPGPAIHLKHQEMTVTDRTDQQPSSDTPTTPDQGSTEQDARDYRDAEQSRQASNRAPGLGY